MSHCNFCTDGTRGLHCTRCGVEDDSIVLDPEGGPDLCAACASDRDERAADPKRRPARLFGGGAAGWFGLPAPGDVEVLLAERDELRLVLLAEQGRVRALREALTPFATYGVAAGARQIEAFAPSSGVACVSASGTNVWIRMSDIVRAMDVLAAVEAADAAAEGGEG